MASDNLNQVGKGLRKTRKDTDYALKKYHKFPRIERSRDIFDFETSFTMEFRTLSDAETITADLTFKKPPPLGGCKSDCLSGACEDFTFGSSGGHLITVANPYIAGSVRIFLNDNPLDSSQFEETNPDAGQIYYQGAAGTAVACYVYGDCSGEIPPSDCEPFFLETFTRSNASEWGPLTEDQAHVWVSDSDDVSTVDLVNGRGRLLVPSLVEDVDFPFARVNLGIANNRDFRASWIMHIVSQDNVTTDTTPYIDWTWGQLSITLEVGGVAGPTTGQAWEFFYSGGPVGLNNGRYVASLATGVDYNVKIERNDLLYMFKFWKDSDLEPDNWQLTITGTSTFNSGNMTFSLGGAGAAEASIPFEVLFDNINVELCDFTCIDGTITYTIDDFTRGSTNSWGTADNGFPWVPQFGTQIIESVNGIQGVLTFDNHNIRRMNLLLDNSLFAGKAWAEFRVLSSSSLPNYAPNSLSPGDKIEFGSYVMSINNQKEGFDQRFIAIYGEAPSAVIPATPTSQSDGRFRFQAFNGSSNDIMTSTTGPATEPDVFYWTVLRINDTDNTINFKSWDASDPEPTNWDEFAPQGLEVNRLFSTNDIKEVEIDAIVQVADESPLDFPGTVKIDKILIIVPSC